MTRLPCVKDLADWIRLEQTPGVGVETSRKLLAAFGLPGNIFRASLADLRNVVSERIANALSAPCSSEIEARIETVMAWAGQPGNHVLTWADENYPKPLLNISDPPVVLYAKGRVELLSMPSIAIVGSRNATAQGIANAEKFAQALSKAGLAVVSGMALGIDTAAHQGALREQGSTIAVIGTGIDIVYPARNHALAHRIATAGCIVSEYPLSTPALAANFPRRNRIISGLSSGVLVVEAAVQSGSLITARMANEQGREVFAIPGSIHSPLSKGCHDLIRQGAKLVESAEHVLEELPDFHVSMPMPRQVASAPCDHAPSPVLAALGFDPADFDTLMARTRLDAASLNAELLTLELIGALELLPGGIYRRLG